MKDNTRNPSNERATKAEGGWKGFAFRMINIDSHNKHENANDGKFVVNIKFGT